MKNVLMSLPSKNSTGTDNISYRLLKEAGPGVVGPPITLFNISLRTGEVPGEWKCAMVSPIFKGRNRDRQEATNYRPISLTSCVARGFEKLINVHLLKYLQENSLLCHQQGGFLPSQSTITQLCFLTHKWQTALDKGDNVEAVFLDLLVQKWQMAIDKGEHVQAAFLDLSKAYDRVGIPGLISKLSALGFSRSSLSWLRSFLTNRKQCVCVNGFKSSWQSPKSIRHPTRDHSAGTSIVPNFHQ